MTKTYWRYLLIIFVASFIIRLCFSIFYVGFNADLLNPRFQLSDSGKYQSLALSLTQDHSFGDDATTSPGYPVFLALIYSFFGTGSGAVQIAQALLSSLMVLFIFAIAREIFGDRTAWLAAIVSAMYPFFIYWSGMLISETLFVFFYVAAFYFILKHSLHTRTSANVLGALCLGLAALVRPVALPFIGFVYLGYLIALRGTFRKALISIALFTVIFFATMSPWILHNHLQTGKITLSSNRSGLIFLNGMNSEIINDPTKVNTVLYPNLDEYTHDIALRDRSEQNKRAKEIVIGHYKYLIRNDPALLLTILKNKFIQIWDIIPREKPLPFMLVSIFSFGFLMPFALIGLYCGVKHKRPMFFLFAAFVKTTLVGLIFMPTIRYRFPVEPFYVIVACYGLLHTKLLFSRLSVKSHKEK